jgi:hypothetical protein
VLMYLHDDNYKTMCDIIYIILNILYEFSNHILHNQKT